MKVTVKVWIIILGAFWITLGVISAVTGDYLDAIIALAGLLSLVLYHLTTVNYRLEIIAQQHRIGQLKQQVAGLEARMRIIRNE